MGFARGFCWAFLGFAHKVNEFGPFFADSMILWPNFGSSVINCIICGIRWVIFVKGPKIIYGVYMGNICGSPNWVII